MIRVLVTCLLSIATLYCAAQSNLFIDQTVSVETMVNDFFDSDEIVIANVTLTGNPEGVGFFDAGGTDLDIPAGILLSTGNAATVASPASNFISASLGQSGDSDIDGSAEATIIEFDFTPTVSDTLAFSYVFGSEEYPEYVCSGFNDQFRFLISGPGLPSDPGSSGFNASLVPGTDQVVSIDNVNSGNGQNCPPANEQYYVNNFNSTHLAFDGRTVCLPAKFFVQAGETYHAKIIVADVADSIYDSGVFIGVNSLGADSLLVPPAGFEASVVTGNTVEFQNTSRYARSWQWDFGNGETSSERNPDPVTYDQDGVYQVQLITENYCCADTMTTEITIGEVLSITTDISNQQLACFGDTNASVSFNISGAEAPYTYTSTPPDVDFSMLGAGSYSVTVTANNGQTATTSFEITQPIELLASTDQTPDNGQASGTAIVTASGGTPPYSYLWSNGGTTATIKQLPAGTYSITVTDANGCETETTVEVDTQVDTDDLQLAEPYRVTVAPNPNKGEFWLDISPEIEVRELSLYDVSGKLVARLGTSHRITLPEHLRGYFRLRVLFGDGEVRWVRLVVI